MRDIFGKKLERDKPTERRVFGLVNYTHPAATELLDDAVVRNGLADHGDAAMLWPKPVAVNESREVSRISRRFSKKNPHYTKDAIVRVDAWRD